MRRSLRSGLGGACMLMCGMLAPLCIEAAAAPDALPEALWWGARAPAPLAESPLGLAEPARMALDATWWPLYRGPRGARIEGERRTIRLASNPGRARAGIELLHDRRALAGGDNAFALGARQLPDRRGTASGMLALARADLGASVSVSVDRASGHAFGARLRPFPGWESEWRAARLAERGTLGVRWQDETVFARAEWTDRTLEWTLRGHDTRSSVELGLIALDRSPRHGERDERVETALAWRGMRASARIERIGARWDVAFAHGAGRQTIGVYRDGARYVEVAGPVANATASLAMRPARSTLGARGWAGAWTGDASGALALWAFDGLAGALGSRRVAQSEVSLRHAGLALERGEEPALRWGLALWWVEPRASFRSWQSTILGVGRDDYSEGDSPLRSALLAGIKLAPAFHVAGTRVRCEIVQWAPVLIHRRESGTPDSPGGGGGTPRGSEEHHGPPTWGGTVLRMRVEL